MTIGRIFKDSDTETTTDNTYEQMVHDGLGGQETPLLDLSEGDHNISPISQREPTVLEEISFFNDEPVLPDAELQRQYQFTGTADSGN